MNRTMMFLALAAATLAGCVAVPVEPPPAQSASAGATAASLPPSTRYIREQERFRAEVGERRAATEPRNDHVADALIRCASLGFTRGSDGHQNCVLRAMDRVDHVAQRYMRQDDEISVRVPRYVELPPVAVAPAVPAPSTTSLVDCRIDPRPPCSMPQMLPERWTYGGQASPPDRP